jgi:thioredoxin-dependent peroxiredoxin
MLGIFQNAGGIGMKRSLIAYALLAILIGIPARSFSETLKVGDKAPDFTLPDQNGKPVHLADFLGKKNVVLAFYVLAFTGG